MGLEAGRQLAEKGANVVIVARDSAKLKEGLEYIEVPHTRGHEAYISRLTADLGRSCRPNQPEISLHQRRLDLAPRVYSDH